VNDSVRERLVRETLRGLSRIHPMLAEHLTIRLFSTPPRPRPPVDPSPPELPGTRRIFSWGGRSLAGWQWGAGPTILLSHGWGGHAGHLTAFIPALVAAHHAVIAFDHPAHGQSTGARSNMLEFRDAVLAVARSCSPVGIIGHSLGATATILALDRGLQVGRVALIAPPLDPAGFARPFAESLGLAEPRVRAIEDRLRQFVQADLGDRDAVTVGKTQTLPALFIHDRDDRAVPFGHGQALAASWRNSKFLGTNGRGHRRILSDPDVVAAAVEFVTAQAD
jgi:pimeloyl-ACP methyl ester carboxylesterase